MIIYQQDRPAVDDWEWAVKFIATWLEICPELEPDIMDMRDDYLTEPEIAHRLLDAVGQAFVTHAPRFAGPPGILVKDDKP